MVSCHFFIPVVIVTLLTISSSVKGQKTTVPSTTAAPSTDAASSTDTTQSTERFQFCASTETFCQNGGTCYVNVNNSPSSRFCHCALDYSGTQCETKTEKNLKTGLYVIIFFAALFFIIAVMLACHLYVKHGEMSRLKRKHEKEKEQTNKGNASPKVRYSPRPHHKGINEVMPEEDDGPDSIIIDNTKNEAKTPKNVSFDQGKHFLNVKNNPAKDKYVADLAKVQESDTESINSSACLIPNKNISNAERQNSLSEQNQDVKRASSLTDISLRSWTDSLDGHEKPRLRDKSHLSPIEVRKQKARSLQDLREIQMSGDSGDEREKKKNVKNGYIENIHTGQITKIESPRLSPKVHRKPMGIWARQQEEKLASL